MSPDRRLPAAALAVEFVGSLFNLGQAALPVLVGLLISGKSDYLDLIVIGALPLALVYTVLSHRRFRYGVIDGQLVVESGILWRQRRTLPVARIHSVSLRRGPVHRLFGIVEVSFEAVGTSGADARIPGVSDEEAERLRQLETGSETPAEAPALGPIWQGGLREILAHGATDFRIGLGLGALAGLWWSGIGRLVVDRPEFDIVSSLLLFHAVTGGLMAQVAAFFVHAVTVVAVLLPLLIVLGWVSSIVYSLLRYGYFVLSTDARGLLVRHGLFVHRDRSIPSSRLQLLTVEEPVLRRLVGRGSISAETAGDAASNSSEGHILLIPVAERDELLELVAKLDPKAKLAEAEWLPVHRRTLERQLIRAGAVLLACGGLAIAARSYEAAIAGLVLATIDAARSVIRYRYTRFSISDRRFMLRTGALGRRLWIVPLDKVQGVSVVQGPLSRRRDLAAVRVDTAGSTIRGHVSLRYLGTADAVALARRLALAARQGASDGV